MQWIPFHSLSETDYKMILRTFRSVFPHATLWYTGGSHTLILATPKPLTDEDLAARLEAATSNAIVTGDLGDTATLRGYLAMDEDALGEFAGAGPLATDNSAYFLPHAGDVQSVFGVMQAAVAEQP